MFVETLAQVFQGGKLDLFDAAFVEVLSNATKMHKLHNETHPMPEDYKTLLLVHKIFLLRQGEQNNAVHKTIVECAYSAQMSVNGKFGERLKSVAGESIFGVFQTYVKGVITSDSMEVSRKAAIADCQPVFEAAERTDENIICFFLILIFDFGFHSYFHFFLFVFF